MNEMIHKARTKAGLRQWQVAEIIGMREDAFSKKLRHELSEDEQRRIVAAIHQHEQEAGKHDGSITK